MKGLLTIVLIFGLHCCHSQKGFDFVQNVKHAISSKMLSP